MTEELSQSGRITLAPEFGGELYVFPPVIEGYTYTTSFQQLKVKKLSEDAVLPQRAKDGDAGYDVVAIDNGTWSKDGTYIEYKTGIAIEVPNGYHTELFPRSSITKTDLVLGNSIGLVDNGYRNEILFRFKAVKRHGEDIITYKKGDRIGQIVIRRTESLEICEVNELSQTERGMGGFGSTGK